MTSGTTKVLNGITCLSATSCVATGQTGTIDVLSGIDVDPRPRRPSAASAFLAGVTCLTANDCYATGHQGVTVNFDSTNVGGTVTQLNGGGYTGTLDALSPARAPPRCIAVGASGHDRRDDQRRPDLAAADVRAPRRPSTASPARRATASRSARAGRSSTRPTAARPGRRRPPASARVRRSRRCPAPARPASPWRPVGLILGTSNYGGDVDRADPDADASHRHQAATDHRRTLAATGSGITRQRRGRELERDHWRRSRSRARSRRCSASSPYTFGGDSFTADGHQRHIDAHLLERPTPRTSSTACR